jgi:hypothetical protein
VRSSLFAREGTVVSAADELRFNVDLGTQGRTELNAFLAEGPFAVRQQTAGAVCVDERTGMKSADEVSPEPVSAQSLTP